MKARTRKFKCIQKKTSYNPKVELEIKAYVGDEEARINSGLPAMMIFLDGKDGINSIGLTRDQMNKLKKFLNEAE